MCEHKTLVLTKTLNNQIIQVVFTGFQEDGLGFQEDGLGFKRMTCNSGWARGTDCDKYASDKEGFNSKLQ